MKPVVLFGTGEIAECVHYFLMNDSEFEVVAFTSDRDRITSSTFRGLPVVPFDEVELFYPPQTHDMFIAVGYHGLNNLRTQKYLEGKKKGYDFITYICSRSSIWPDLKIGENCFLAENNVLHPFVTIEDNVFVWSSNLIGHHSYVSANCFITSNVVMGGRVKIEEFCFIGINSSIKHNVRINRNCIVGAGSLILTDTTEGGSYIVETTKQSRIPSSMLGRVITGKRG